MANTLLLPETTIAGFTYQEGDGYSTSPVLQSPVSIEAGKAYAVVWDGVEYTGNAFWADEASAVIALGNAAFFGGDYTEEPFCIVYSQVENIVIIAALGEETSHTIAIYEQSETEDSIVLKDRLGNDVVHDGIEILQIPTVSGGVQDFSKGLAVEETIEPNFSEGDMVISPEKNTLFKKITLTKPQHLTPENIPEGVEIAGVVGTRSDYTPTETTITPDFSEGDMVVSPSGKNLFSKVTVEKPTNLLPENIAKDVEIAGIVGTREGGSSVEEVVITAFAQKGYAVKSYVTTAKTITGDATATIPKGAKIHFIGSNALTGTIYSNTYPAHLFITSLSPTGHTITEGENSTAISRNVSFYVSKSYSYAWVAAVLVMYSIAGLFVTKGQSGELTLICDDTVSDLYGAQGWSRKNEVTVADFSKAAITSLSSFFEGCAALKTVHLPQAITSLVTKAFKDCVALESITIPSSVTTFGDYVFQNCTALQSITLPASLTSLSGNTFQDCTALESVVIPDGVTSLGSAVFKNCKKLNGVVLPSSLKSIENNAFYSCEALTRIEIPSSVTSMGNYTFSYCKMLESVVVQEGATTIGSYTFQYCTALSSVSLPTTINKIGEWSFCGCNALSNITIPSGVTTLGTYVFYNCTALETFTVEGALTSIGTSAFYKTTSLKTVDLTNCTAVPTLGSSNFASHATDFEIRVPAALYDSFCAASNWSTYASYIVAVE